ncbi:hypothetical protein VTI74DRAFT_4369 [Chaetomium olivicolor]
MPCFCTTQYRPSSVLSRRRRLFRRVRNGVCKTFHDHPEHSISSPSVVLLDESKRRPRLIDRLSSISEIQFRPGIWEDRETSAAPSRNVMLPACQRLQNSDSSPRIPWPQANTGTKRLMELSDSVRASLAKHGTFGPHADQLSMFLELAMIEEAERAPTVDFETIKAARLDKLVADLTESGELASSLSGRLVHDAVTAAKLERR